MTLTVGEIITALRSRLEISRGIKLPPLYKQILVASGPLISTISLGMTSGFSAILLPQLENETSIEINRSDASWIASMAALPMAFGCLLGGLLMEKFGRKATQLLTNIPCLIGWVLIALSSNLPMVLTGRFLTGLCGGLLGPSTGVYISETAEPRYRDFLLGAISLFLAVGLFLVHLLGTFLHWKTTAIICSFFPIVSFFLLILVPESPSWLAKNKRISDAEKAFFWCRGDTEASKKEVAVLTQRQNMKNEEPQLAQLVKKEFLKPLIIITVFIVTNQWAGVNALTFYTVTIMQKTLTNGLDTYLAMLIVDLIRLLMSVLACIIMKHVRRRPLAIISGVGTFTSLFLLSGYTNFVKLHPDLGTFWYTIIPMVSLVAYISFITVGFVPLPWAMMGEVFPLNTRNVGSSISSFMAFAAFFAVVKTNPAMFDVLGVDGTFLVYGLVAFWGTVFVWVFLPETKGKALHEIEDQMAGR
ncbi:facilitated trehalose transporter Tret1-like [Zophobas morio]|uniref:facilitated trehalose transporter Tret1-like n=1 Tax=Zophobas morio TaxID=2755281 RepID=UPI0030826F62